MVLFGKVMGVFLVLGLVGGILFDQFEHTGALVGWEQLPMPADTKAELVAVGFRSATLIDRDGVIWECSSRETICIETENILGRLEDMHPCNFPWPAFWIFSNYPQNIVECVQSRIQYADAVEYAIAIKDVEGNLWLWDNFRGTFLREEALFVKHLFIGVFIGLMVGLIVYPGVRRRYRIQEKI